MSINYNNAANNSENATNNSAPNSADIKKRKLDPVVHVSKQTPSTSNAFEPLAAFGGMSVDEIINSAETKKPKIPPVVVYHNFNLDTINKIKGKLSKDIKIKYMGNRSNIYTENLEDYNTILQYAKETKYEHYTHTPKELKEFKMILKNISPHISESEIKEDLERQDLKINRVKQMAKKLENNTELKLPVFIINFAPNTLKRDIFKIKYVCNSVIQWDHYQSNIKIIQCFRCQGFNHISTNCFKNPVCRKCSGPHFTSACIDSSNLVIKCVNCKGEHEANSAECVVYNRVLLAKENRKSPPKTDTPIAAPEVNTADFPPLPAEIEPQPIQQTTDSNLVQTNNQSTMINNNSQSSFKELFAEIKGIFNGINLVKVKSVVSNTLTKIKTVNSSFDKLWIIAEGLLDMFNDG